MPGLTLLSPFALIPGFRPPTPAAIAPSARPKARSSSRGAIPSAFAVVLLLAPIARAQAPCGGASGSPIALTNLSGNETVSHEILLVEGKLSAAAATVRVASGSSSLDWPAFGTAFKALVRLAPGGNRIVIAAAGHADRCLDIAFVPADTGNMIQLVHFLPKDQPDGPGHFKAPAGMPTDAAAAHDRYRFGALLAQSAVAELMHRAGRGRRTFALKRDLQGRVDVGVHRSERTLAELRATSSGSAHGLLHNGARKVWPDKRLSLLGFVQADSILDNYYQTMPIHVFSSLYTWPTDLDQVVKALTDATRKTQNGTGSGPHDTLPLWWHASWELGNLIRVQGWIFGAPATTSRTDLMGDGFRHFRNLVLAGADGKPLPQDSLAFGDTTAGHFAFSPWIRAVPSATTRLAGPAAGPGLSFRVRPGAGGIRVDAPRSGDLRITPVTPAGRRAAPLFRGRLSAGTHVLPWPEDLRVPGTLLLVETRQGRNLLPLLP